MLPSHQVDRKERRARPSRKKVHTVFLPTELARLDVVDVYAKISRSNNHHWTMRKFPTSNTNRAFWRRYRDPSCNSVWEPSVVAKSVDDASSITVTITIARDQYWWCEFRVVVDGVG